MSRSPGSGVPPPEPSGVVEVHPQCDGVSRGSPRLHVGGAEVRAVRGVGVLVMGAELVRRVEGDPGAPPAAEPLGLDATVFVPGTGSPSLA